MSAHHQPSHLDPLNSLLSHFTPPASMPQPITAKPMVQVAEDVQAVINGTATPEQTSRHLIRVMRAELEEQVNDQVWLEGDSNERGRFQYVATDVIEIELHDDEYRGWVEDDRPGYFTGQTDEGYGWEATSKSVVEGKHSVRMTLRIESV